MQIHVTHADVFHTYQGLVYNLQPMLGVEYQRRAHAHCVEQSDEVRSVRWGTHQSASEIQCRAF